MFWTILFSMRMRAYMCSKVKRREWMTLMLGKKDKTRRLHLSHRLRLIYLCPVGLHTQTANLLIHFLSIYHGYTYIHTHTHTHIHTHTHTYIYIYIIIVYGCHSLTWWVCGRQKYCIIWRVFDICDRVVRLEQ